MKCPLCGTGPFHMFIRLTDPVDDEVYTFWLCNCGAVYNNEIKSHDNYDDFMLKKYHREDIERDERLRAIRVAIEIKAWYDEHKLAVPKRVADIGSARGWLLSEIAKWTEYDAAMTPVPYGAELKQDQDLITMVHVLEHLPDPIGYLKDIRKHCKGYLWIEVPSLGSNPAFQPYHVTVFSLWTLGKVLQEAGYKIIRLLMGDDPVRSTRILQAVAVVTDEG